VSLSWIPLPFPECPRCRSSWVQCNHFKCSENGEIFVEPYLQEAKCVGCQKQWPLRQTRFHCSCGYTFNSEEVSEALSTSSLVRKKILEQINEIDFTEKQIKDTVKNSLVSWLSSLGYKLGFAVGTFIKYVDKCIEQLISSES
jgi:hypothetical protein